MEKFQENACKFQIIFCSFVLMSVRRGGGEGGKTRGYNEVAAICVFFGLSGGGGEYIQIKIFNNEEYELPKSVFCRLPLSCSFICLRYMYIVYCESL